jgi:hypothetical protein
LDKKPGLSKRQDLGTLTLPSKKVVLQSMESKAEL